MAQTGKEVATRQKQRALVIRDYLQSDQVKEQIQYAIPQYLNADRFLRIAFTAISKNPTLLECTTESLLSAIIQAATLGLELVLGRAHLVPFKNRQKNVTEVVFIPGYQGLADLMRRSGEVADLWGEVVYTADTFKIMYGLDRSLEHEPKFDLENRGDPVGAYFVVLHRDGTKGWTYMPISEVYKKHRDKSQAYKYAESSGKKDSPWHEFPEDMIKKTVLKKHSKLAPMSVDVSAAVALDDSTEVGAPTERVMADLLAAKGKEAAIEVETEELPEPEPEAAEEEKGVKIDAEVLEKFLELSKEIEERDKFSQFVKASADHFNVTPDEIRVQAVENWPEFVKTFESWLEQRKELPPEQKQTAGPDDTVIAKFHRLNAKSILSFYGKKEDMLLGASMAVKTAWNEKVNKMTSLNAQERTDLTLSMGPPAATGLAESVTFSPTEEAEPEVVEPTVVDAAAELVVSCFKCRKSLNMSDATEFEQEGELYYACDDHKPGAEPEKVDAYWTNVENDLEKWRVELARVDIEERFYEILGAHGATNVKEVIALGDKKAVQEIFEALGTARYPKA